jgi:biotin-dependent carboxylase-like uncharacterized protein
MKAESGFKIVKPGILSLITDLGRYGKHRIGLTTGGPIDPYAFRWANRLLGNDLNASALEASFGGLVLEAQIDSSFVVTGATAPLKINGLDAELWRVHAVSAGDKIELGFATEGCRSYLAVAGGFIISESFGSTATVVRESLGGLAGDKLKAGDILPAHAADGVVENVLAEHLRPDYTGDIVLRVIPGYQQHAFSRFQQRLFFGSDYEVSDRCDRMGYRLTGAEIKPSIDGILSEGICLGAIQVPADGQPIVLLNDRQTIGGYPKIGSMMSLDVARLGQCMPGAKISFQAVTIDCAHNALCLAESHFQRAEATAL